MKPYSVQISFQKALIFNVDVKANSKKEAYAKAKARLAKKLFKPSNLKQYSITEE